MPLQMNISLFTAPWRQNPKAHHRVHNRPPPVPILSQLNPFHTPPANLPKTHSNPILPPMPRSSEWSLSFGIFHQNVHFSLLPHAFHVPRPPYSNWLDLPNDIWGWVQIMKLLTVLTPPFSCYFIPLMSKYSSQNPVLNHPQSMPFLGVRDQVSHPYKTTGRITVLYRLY
jgi:hypothetical protein